MRIQFVYVQSSIFFLIIVFLLMYETEYKQVMPFKVPIRAPLIQGPEIYMVVNSTESADELEYSKFRSSVSAATNQSIVRDATNQSIVSDATNQHIVSDATNQHIVSNAANLSLCEGKVKLESLLDQAFNQPVIFFIETSEKETISGRQACALESAVRNSHLHVVMVRVATHLDLTDVFTCNFLTRFVTMEGLSIYSVDLEELALGTQMEGFFTSPAALGSPHRIPHMSDAARILIISRFGGFYADTDFVIINSLAGRTNQVGSDYVIEEEFNAQHQLMEGNEISNAIFQFEAHNPLIECALDRFYAGYRPDLWAFNGPKLLQKCLAKVCGHETLSPAEMTKENICPGRCQGVQLTHYKDFFPFSWRNNKHLYDRRTLSEWEAFFINTSAVHFYHTSTRNTETDKRAFRPEHYGERMPSLVVLADKHCPFAFWNSEQF